MKLIATAIIVYVVNMFLLPMGVVQLKLATGFMPTGILDLVVYTILPITILVAVASYIYARWAHVALNVGGCLAVALTCLAVPVMAFALAWAVAFYLDPALAVTQLQEMVVPVFAEFEVGNWTPFIDWVLALTPFLIPFFLGPFIASFFARSQAVAEARIIM